MRDLPIELWGSPFLRQIALPVEQFDDALPELVRAMYRTMYRAHGQGLAAPQVGLLQRLVVIDLPDDDAPAITLVNPRITARSVATARFEEGCLSLPGVTGFVTRAHAITVEAFDIRGNVFSLDAEGALADCVQHELDHLDGILYVDHLSPLQRQLVLRRYDKLSMRARRSGTA
jgi:peptide deformylase